MTPTKSLRLTSYILNGRSLSFQCSRITIRDVEVLTSLFTLNKLLYLLIIYDTAINLSFITYCPLKASLREISCNYRFPLLFT